MARPERSNAYVVPNANDCKRCHTTGELFEPIGPRARYLNKDYDYADGPENQLVHWTQRGHFNRCSGRSRAGTQIGCVE